MSAAPISTRPSVKTGEDIARVSAELNLSPGQFVIAAAEALIRMADSPTPHVPKIVTVLRTLRANDATFAHPERPFPRVEVFEEVSSEKAAEEPSRRRSRNGRGK